VTFHETGDFGGKEMPIVYHDVAIDQCKIDLLGRTKHSGGKGVVYGGTCVRKMVQAQADHIGCFARRELPNIVPSQDLGAAASRHPQGLFCREPRGVAHNPLQKHSRPRFG